MFERSTLRGVALRMAFAMPGIAVLALASHAAGLWEPKGFLERFQTLFAGIIAIVAALIGGAFILHQVRATERLEEDRRRREFRGARAGLSAVLGLISDYREKCTKELDRLYGTMTSPTSLIPMGPCSFPEPPPEVIPGLKELVALGSDHEAEVIADLLSHLQVVRSRQRSLADAVEKQTQLIVGAPDLESGVYDMAKLDAMTSRLFDFARRRAPCPDGFLANKEIAAALGRLEVDHSLQANVAFKYRLQP